MFPRPLLIGTNESPSQGLPLGSPLEEQEEGEGRRGDGTFDLGNDDNQEEEETTPKLGGVGDPVVARCGVSTMLHVDEYAELQPGSLDLGPSVNIGQLLDPIEGATLEPPGIRGEPRDQHNVLISLDEFLSLMGTLGYCESDVVLAKRVYSAIEESGRSGISETSLSEGLEGWVRPGGVAIGDVVQDLLNFEMVRTNYYTSSWLIFFLSYSHCLSPLLSLPSPPPSSLSLSGVFSRCGSLCTSC